MIEIVVEQKRDDESASKSEVVMLQGAYPTVQRPDYGILNNELQTSLKL
jgi:hypothetical protein